MNNPVLSCQSVSKVFDNGPAPLAVLNDVSLHVNAGERVAIIGTSGSGKSTLLHCIGGLDDVTSGDVFVSGKKLTDLKDADITRLRNTALGFVYQFHHLLPEFTAEENVALPLMLGGANYKEAAEKANILLNAVGLSPRRLHKPSELSGGERQRVAIARALVNTPACVLADEPTGNLDQATADTIFDLMIKLSEEHNTGFLIVTHDTSLASRMDRVLTLVDGAIETVS